MIYKRLVQYCLALSAAGTLISGFNVGSPRKSPHSTPSETSSVFSHRNSNGEECSLSSSVLASCDTLPSFPTAHGLLCPETVQRMERSAGPNDKVVARFLDRYHRHGPMSCIELLSDPEVLPHLTSALRDLA